uniref:receptor protein-tyrosine kinase n=1 Tax=Latimeria chalumnae TaxID=7897 RepID=H3BEV2_LATCH
FLESPSNVTSSLGKDIQLNCKVLASRELLEIVWHRNGERLDLADTNQVVMPMNEDVWMAISVLRIPTVGLPDAGDYSCVVVVNGEQIESEQAHLELEGLPHFSEEPQDRSVTASVGFNLSCAAEGPPEPVSVIWYQDGAPLNSLMDLHTHTHTGRVPGLNKSSTFSCEAHNTKGVTTSRTATVKVLPNKPRNLKLVNRSTNSLEIMWEVGFSGDHAVTVCTVQAIRSDADLSTVPHHMIYNQNLNVPPYSHVISGLDPFTSYHVRLACRSSAGVSQWTHWVTMETLEGVPEFPPENVTAFYNGSMVIVRWAEPMRNLNGVLKGYKLAYWSPDSPEVVLDASLVEEMTFDVALPFTNLMVQVASYTAVGDGPWSNPIAVSFNMLVNKDSLPLHQQVMEGPEPTFSWHWWYIVMAAAAAVACAVLLAIFLARLRKKETRFGEAFEPMMESGELVVRYRVKKSYGRRTTEATLNTLGISDELKEKLQDVMVDRHKLALGKTLGEGEFGSVMEGQLNQDDYILKVAVKTMKIAICTRSEMEDFLREAVCMKEFDHPNVMRLIGVCLQNRENEGYPSPVVILPFMKHGDLHSFLLYSRLGESPVYLPTQTLVKFMTDIARGMEYLSTKHFIHRDLAARNCMLNENMNVCVADFGLSKKIYNGDYYRQGRISKMPVKWIAVESLADRVYTSKSDVWSFGVTMWEIATRGQTPYPGVENSEIYDYLRQGNRLKQPPDCLDGLYQLMFSCWLLNPKDRPTFELLRCELEKTLEGLPPVQDPEDILYVNMEDMCTQLEEAGELGAVGGLEQDDRGKDSSLHPLKSTLVTADVHQREPNNRYVLCPPPENTRLLAEAQSTENLACSAIEEELLDYVRAPLKK